MWQGTTQVALKKLLDQAHFQTFANEAAILQAISHPHVVSFLGVYTDDDGFKYIVTEYMNKGSLLSVVQQERLKLTAADLLAMARHAAAGMRYLEKQNIIHRDVALRNLLVTLSGEDGKYLVKVGDFGLARFTAHGYYNVREASIPVRWAAPECFTYGVYDSSCDVWSFGVLLWELFSYGQIPYAGFSNEEVIQKVSTGYRLPCPEDCREELYQLMLPCWNSVPSKRPNFFNIFKVIDDEYMQLKRGSSPIAEAMGLDEAHPMPVMSHESKHGSIVEMEDISHATFPHLTGVKRVESIILNREDCNSIAIYN